MTEISKSVKANHAVSVLGATFTSDELIWQFSGDRFWERSWQQLQEKFLGQPPDPGFYHPDYWQEFNYGDDP